MQRPSVLACRAARYRKVIPAGDYWIDVVKKRPAFSGSSTWKAIKPPTPCFSAADPRERYSIVDTMREQRNVYLGVGSKLLSTAGNTLARDRCRYRGAPRHARAAPARRSRTPCAMRSTSGPCIPAATATCWPWREHEQFGLSKRDLTHNINFFMNVPVTAEGGLTFADGLSGPGQYVELRAAMDIIVLISNCPQLNNPCNAYNPTPLEILIWDPDVS